MSSSQSNAERLLANRSPGLTGGPLRTVEVSQDYVFGASAGRGTSSNTTGGAVHATSTTGVAGNPVTAGYGDASESRTPSAVRAGRVDDLDDRTPSAVRAGRVDDFDGRTPPAARAGQRDDSGLFTERMASYGRGEMKSPADSVATSRVSRSEAHTSELQTLMRISYAVLCTK